MIKLHFDHNKNHTEKAEDQKVVLPVEKELNEQELATVTGGWRRHHWGWWGWWGGCGWGCGGCGWGGCGC